MLQTSLKQAKEIDRLLLSNSDLQKSVDRIGIFKQELTDQLEAKEDLIASLEDSLEQAKY